MATCWPPREALAHRGETLACFALPSGLDDWGPFEWPSYPQGWKLIAHIPGRESKFRLPLHGIQSLDGRRSVRILSIEVRAVGKPDIRERPSYDAKELDYGSGYGNEIRTSSDSDAMRTTDDLFIAVDLPAGDAWYGREARLDIEAMVTCPVPVGGTSFTEKEEEVRVGEDFAFMTHDEVTEQTRCEALVKQADAERSAATLRWSGFRDTCYAMGGVGAGLSVLFCGFWVWSAHKRKLQGTRPRGA